MATGRLDPVTDPLIDQVLDTTGDLSTGRRMPRALRPLLTPAYRTLAVALVFSSFAHGVWTVALVWEVFGMGGGAGQLSAVSTASALGVILPALVAGVVADRVPQRRILLGVAAAEALAMGVAGVFSALDLNTVALLAVLAFTAGLAMAFYYPAYSALLPALVPEEDLMAVNGLEGMVRPSIGQVLGPAVSGMVVGLAAPSASFAVAFGAMTISFLALLRVPRTALRRDLSTSTDTHPVRATLQDVAEGFGYMVRTPWLLATLLFACLMVLVMMGPMEVLIPVLIKNELSGGAGDHAWVLAGFGVGGALGSLTMASIAMPRRYLTWMFLMWGVAGAPFLLIAFEPRLWIMVAGAVVMGAMFSAPQVIWGTLLQRRVPADLLGRVSSLDFFVSIALMPVSMAMAGPVSQWIGLRTTFLIAALVPALTALVAFVWARLDRDEVAHPLD